MAYTNPEAAQQLPFPEEAAAAIRAALGDNFTVTGESGIGSVTNVQGDSFSDPDGLSPVILFDDNGTGARFEADENETLDRFVAGTSGDDNFKTGGGSDEVLIGAGNDNVDTGTGTDVVHVNGAFNANRIKVNEDGSISIDNGNGQTATVRNTEVIQFEDTKVVVSDNVKDGAIALLYEAAFDRQIDNAGYKFWTQGAADDLTVEEIADFFTSSEEFQGFFASATNEEFVAQIYNNFFDRGVDQAGFEFYTALLNDGVIDRGDFLADIADSGEALELFKEIVKVIGVNTDSSTDDFGSA